MTKNNSKYTLDDIGGKLDLAHLAATTESYVSCLVPRTWTGWAGDLATGMGDTMQMLKENKGQNVVELAKKIIGSDASSCNYVDLCCDADAIKLAELLKDSTSLDNPLSSSLKRYYSAYHVSRYSYYLQDLDNDGDLDKMEAKIYSVMNTGYIIDAEMTTVVALLNDEMPSWIVFQLRKESLLCLLESLSCYY